MKAVCVNPACGKEFDSRRGAKGCSKECRAEWNRIINRGKCRAKIQEERPCAVCGEMFRPRNDLQRYCGKACANTAEAIRRRNRNSVFQPGVSAWTLDRCPYAAGLVETEDGRLPDEALGF